MTKTRIHAHIFISFCCWCTRTDKARRASLMGGKKSAVNCFNVAIHQDIWDRDRSDRIITVCLNNYGFRNQTIKLARLLRETRSGKAGEGRFVMAMKTENLDSSMKSLIDDFWWLSRLTTHSIVPSSRQSKGSAHRKCVETSSPPTFPLAFDPFVGKHFSPSQSLLADKTVYASTANFILYSWTGKHEKKQLKAHLPPTDVMTY